MSADILLQHLQKVKRTKPDSWLACCPSHEDESASLSIRELGDGRVLVHCFAGCSVPEIVAAVGLELSDLFPPRDKDKHYKKGERRPFPAADILRAIASEAKLVYLCAQFVARGNKLPQSDLDRLLTAASRLEAALHAGGIHAN
jgi:hypothetical protein